MENEKSLCRRRERRFKTRAGHILHCETLVKGDKMHHGTVIDISPSGLRLLCEGKFAIGETFVVELKTERSHGSYEGIVRRVEPWVAGQSVIGCQLTQKIPDEILETLARENVVDRRRDGRVPWTQPAHMSWELQAGEVDVTVCDCSPGGLKIISKTPIPDATRLRIRMTPDGGDELVINAKSVWQTEDADTYVVGVEFTKKDLPEVIARVLEENDPDRVPTARTVTVHRWIRRSVLVAASVTILAFGLSQTNAWTAIQQLDYDELLTRMQILTKAFTRD
ncbi:PilZ domain-containing protein [Stieleria varia]|uniref:PilZ domain protein n=1 Tax=Stieleria varia TaxID=2528005 RepID=A0A5C5ZPP0_9BACT|nr:PilZ domain-containing protein [Stieleria varia]TWT89439.1 PilZ domain protein [Stieleria varia]